jgi:hypothetical protein
MLKRYLKLPFNSTKNTERTISASTAYFCLFEPLNPQPKRTIKERPRADNIIEGIKKRKRSNTKSAEANNIETDATKIQEVKRLEISDLKVDKNKNPTIMRKIRS